MRAHLSKSAVPAFRSLRSRQSRTWPWICTSCYARSFPNRSFASQSPPDHKPYYITTPIFYVNAGSHASLPYPPHARRLTLPNSAPCRPPVHARARRHSQTMAGAQGREGHYVHGDGRARLEGRSRLHTLLSTRPLTPTRFSARPQKPASTPSCSATRALPSLRSLQQRP